MNYSDKDQKYKNAKNRVEQLRKFYSHLTVYLVVNIAIFSFKIVKNLGHGVSFEDAFFNLRYSGIWLFWGIGLALHAFSVFGLPLIIGYDWEEKKIKQFMDEENKNKF